MDKKVPMQELFPIIAEKLAAGGSVTLEITGTSMLPLFVAGRDRVVLVKSEGHLKKMDMPLYRRSSGQFVLHRIVGLRKDGYILRGDNQYINEYGITDENICGVVAGIWSDGKYINLSSPSAWYRRYCVRLGLVQMLRLARCRLGAVRRRFFEKK